MGKGSLLHWGPLTALSIIITLFIGSVYSSLLWWSPTEYVTGIINIGLLVVFLLCIIFNFVKAAWVGPGYVPNQWKPENDKDKKYMQFCKICDGYKAPRSHHCRQCNRCVMKMDHHCPWINNCVGHKNHKRFTLFLFFVVIGCSYAAYSLIGCVFQLFIFNYNIVKETLKNLPKVQDLLKNFIQGNPLVLRDIMAKQLVPFGFYHVLGIVFCIGLDLGVIIAVGILLYYQACDIIHNASSIEGWIKDKSSYRSKKESKFIYPYDLGKWENIKQVINFSGDYIGDGITWPVIAGSHQYALTIEQLRQKQMKKHYSVDYLSVEEFNGSCCGWKQGCFVCITCPWSLERRLRFLKGDRISVTRWRKRWLYGLKIQDDTDVKDPEKGWFPRKCVVKDEDDDLTDPIKKNKQKSE